jgi:hypothetical protein
MAPTFVERVTDMVRTIEGLGPNPLRTRDVRESRPVQKA